MRGRPWKRRERVKTTAGETLTRFARWFFPFPSPSTPVTQAIWRRHVGALARGTNMAAAKHQKYLSLSFAFEGKTYYSRVLIH